MRLSETELMLKILELFRQSCKQFIVAVDKGKSYTDKSRIPEVIKETIILRLSLSHELFGRALNKVSLEGKTSSETTQSKLVEN